jgi:hypothetical protein
VLKRPVIDQHAAKKLDAFLTDQHRKTGSLEGHVAGSLLPIESQGVLYAGYPSVFRPRQSP